MSAFTTGWKLVLRFSIIGAFLLVLLAPERIDSLVLEVATPLVAIWVVERPNAVH